jgi:hypothetical protein
MPWFMQIALGLALWSAGTSAVVGQELPVKPKPTVELRWVEGKRVEGLTEDKGFQVGEGEEYFAYPHKKPALVITAAEVADVRLTKQDFSSSGDPPRELYWVTIQLTKEAREKVDAAREGVERRFFCHVVDGGYHSWEGERQKTFTFGVGFFSSKAEAQRLVDAFK